MPSLENALLRLNSLGRPAYGKISATSMLVVTLLFIVAVLSVPLYEPQRLVWFAIYPVVTAEMTGIRFARVFLKSLWVLPLILLIGIFNPILDRQTAFSIGAMAVSRGWVSFLSLSLRGLLAVQAALILTMCGGFYGMCAALRRIGCPRVLVTQILFTYRYILVISQEALQMDRARRSRGFGRKNYPFSMWGRMVGQLLVRSYDRANRIHKAMLARAFNGSMPICDASLGETSSRRASLAFLIVWTAVLAILRFADFPAILANAQTLF